MVTICMLVAKIIIPMHGFYHEVIQIMIILFNFRLVSYLPKGTDLNIIGDRVEEATTKKLKECN